MSGKFDGIDLNSDAFLVEAFDGVRKNPSVKRDPSDMGGASGTSSVDGFRMLGEAMGSGNGVSEWENGGIGLKTGGLEDRNVRVGCEAGICNLGFVKWASSVDGFRVLREAKESANGVSEGVLGKVDVKNGDLEGKNGAFGCGREMNIDGSFSRAKVGERGDNAGRVFLGDGRENQVARVAEMRFNNVLLESLMNGTGKNERKVVSEETNFVGVVEGIGYGTKANLVDINVLYGARKVSLSGNGICNKETEVKEDLIESNVGVNNVAFPSNGMILHGSQDALIKEQITDGNLEGKDGNENDLKVVALRPKIRGEECQTEKEGEYYLSDLVWGKVWGHPWWPGQIFEPSAATEKSMMYFKKDSYLIAYFGDKTFAWNEAARIKPFRMHFTQMEKQSNGGESFCEAVDCALDEISRRVEFGLSCLCLPEEQRAKISSQTVINAGILEEASIRYDKDHISSASTFVPAELLQGLQSLAVAPKSRICRLRFVIARAQLLAFNRWKGFYELPEPVELDGLSEKDANIPAERGGLDLVDDKVQGPRADGEASGRSSALEHGEKKSKGKRGRKKGSFKKHETIESTSSDSNLKRRKRILSPRMRKEPPSRTKKFIKIGEHAPRVASQLGTALESGEESCQSVKGVNGQKLFPEDIPSPEEMLSKLCSTASAPMEGYCSVNSFFCLFCAFRNSVCLQNRNALKRKQSTEEHDGEKSTKSEGVEGIEDSYWADRIIQSNYRELELFENESLQEKRIPVSDPGNAYNASPNLNSRERDAGVLESEVENPAVSVDENAEDYSPTALSLKFSKLESLPSVMDLNKIFSHFGPLNESETKVMDKSKRAKVVFKRRLDAENAFSSAGKFSVFGPSLLCYRLKPLPVKTRAATKRKRKGAKSE